jgi:nitroreductase
MVDRLVGVEVSMAGADDQIRLLRDLRAVRRFAPDPVPDRVVTDLLEVARWSGSSQNRQPWELILVRDRAMLRNLARADGSPGTRHLADAPLAVVLVLTRHQALFDEGRLSERIMLAAAAHGLGSSIAGFGGDALAVKQVLGVPPERTLRTAISVGYPAAAQSRLVSRERDVDSRMPLAAIPVGRRAMSELLHLERYGHRWRDGLA